MLEMVERSGGLNMLLTAAPLCSAYAKICVFGFGRHFAPDRVYSAKEDTSGKIRTMDSCTRYAEKVSSPTPCRFVSVGDGKSEAQAAKKLRLPHIHVAAPANLTQIQQHL